MKLFYAACAVLVLASAGPAWADPQTPPAQSLDGAYRGTLVCEKVKGLPGILRVPLDMSVHAGNVQFARPTFNLKGTRVTGSELGSGTVETDGKLHLASAWVFGNIGFEGDYAGTLTGSGGTLSGKQSWHVHQHRRLDKLARERAYLDGHWLHPSNGSSAARGCPRVSSEDWCDSRLTDPAVLVL